MRVSRMRTRPVVLAVLSLVVFLVLLASYHSLSPLYISKPPISRVWPSPSPENVKQEYHRKSVNEALLPPPAKPKDKKWSRHNDHLSYVRESAAAADLPRRGQLFCWVLTTSKHHETRAAAINETWLHRCDHGEFFTNALFPQNMTGIPYSTVFAGIPDEYSLLFYKTIFALHYQYTYISDQFDWYLKADDDTYVIVEHLRDYLSTLDPAKPYFLGMRLKPFMKDGYNSGGAGYVLSREAMRIFNEKLYMNETACPDGDSEDLQLAQCLLNVGVIPHDTRNAKGQQRFHAYNYHDIYTVGRGTGWYKDEELPGMSAIGEGMISMHYIDPYLMRFIHQLLYHVPARKLT